MISIFPNEVSQWLIVVLLLTILAQMLLIGRMRTTAAKVQECLADTKSTIDFQSKHISDLRGLIEDSREDGYRHANVKKDAE